MSHKTHYLFTFILLTAQSSPLGQGISLELTSDLGPPGLVGPEPMHGEVLDSWTESPLAELLILVGPYLLVGRGRWQKSNQRWVTTAGWEDFIHKSFCYRWATKGLTGQKTVTYKLLTNTWTYKHLNTLTVQKAMRNLQISILCTKDMECFVG